MKEQWLPIDRRTYQAFFEYDESDVLHGYVYEVSGGASFMLSANSREQACEQLAACIATWARGKGLLQLPPRTSNRPKPCSETLGPVELEVVLKPV